MKLFGLGILQSMWLAFKNLFRPSITVQYPKEKLVLPKRARWKVEQLFTEEGLPKCTGCGICIRACPSHVLHLETETDPETKEMTILLYNFQLGACLNCGMCVESCPFDAIVMDHDYELATAYPEDMSLDLLKNVPAFRKKPAPKPKKTEEPGEKPKGDA